VLVLGGSVQTGAAFLAGLTDLGQTIARADLLALAVPRLDFGSMGGDVLTTVTALAGPAMCPVVVITGHNHISERELRTIGVEAAHSVNGDLQQTARAVARTWSW